jgi:acyl carrier protein
LEIEDAVRDLLCSRSPLARSRELPAALPDDLRLGPGGLGLDSIALVELLLDCERRFGLADVAELLAGPPLTVGLLVARLRAVAVGR